MNRFIQLHMLTAYPPANLNRDDQGSPKTAKMGGYDRLRVSSQCLKRTWRTSETFEQALANHLGARTKEMGRKVYQRLIEKGVKHKDALEWTKSIAGVFGKLKTLSKKEKDALKGLSPEERRQQELREVEIEQLAFFDVEEQKAIMSLADELARRNEAKTKAEDKEDSKDSTESEESGEDKDTSKDGKAKDKEEEEEKDIGPTKGELDLLRKHVASVDIALFGRMLASSPAYNIEAACQVAHAISVHPVVIEDDYFTAVDDLNDGQDDLGASHIGETRFAAGLFYSYICINREMLIENLGGDGALASKAVRALVDAAVKVAPSGKQNSFASRAYASYVLAEKGNQQPRSLSIAYLKPINPRENDDFVTDSIKALVKQKDSFDQVYGDCADERYELNVPDEEGTLAELLDFVGQ